jgi:hypothetical protein
MEISANVVAIFPQRKCAARMSSQLFEERTQLFTEAMQRSEGEKG